MWKRSSLHLPFQFTSWTEYKCKKLQQHSIQNVEAEHWNETLKWQLFICQIYDYNCTQFLNNN